jgi:hypothetical protein
MGIDGLMMAVFVCSCLMSVACHPEQPSLIAAGSFNGEVTLTYIDSTHPHLTKRPHLFSLSILCIVCVRCCCWMCRVRVEGPREGRVRGG